MIIHGNLDMGAVEAWKGTADPESIAALPDNVLLKVEPRGESERWNILHSLLRRSEPGVPLKR